MEIIPKRSKKFFFVFNVVFTEGSDQKKYRQKKPKQSINPGTL